MVIKRMTYNIKFPPPPPLFALSYSVACLNANTSASGIIIKLTSPEINIINTTLALISFEINTENNLSIVKKAKTIKLDE
ncbi:hypothetical protein GCM10009411_36660 [Shewanella litoralis]|uniref:PilZ domain-containing protein n=1 Tax=Shewanella litoralis TaxID=2282700 RepID=A0ABQ2RK19_9GAMM|nr:hypothetical protein GCM10009411_36660 [Shewanella litoralis]